MSRHRWVTASRTAGRPASAASRRGSGHALLAGVRDGPAGSPAAQPAVAPPRPSGLSRKHFLRCPACPRPAVTPRPRWGQRPGGGAQRAGHPRQAPRPAHSDPTFHRSSKLALPYVAGRGQRASSTEAPSRRPSGSPSPSPPLTLLHSAPLPVSPPVSTRPVHKCSSVEAWLAGAASDSRLGAGVLGGGAGRAWRSVSGRRQQHRPKSWTLACGKASLEGFQEEGSGGD